MDHNTSKDRVVQIAVFLLRIAAGILFVEVGGLKLFGWFGGVPGGGALPPLLLIAGLLEFFGGTAILLGLFTRPIAFLLSGEMAFAYFIGHAPQGHFFAPLLNQGQPAVLLCFIFLFFAAYGAGEWSIDSIARHRQAWKNLET